MRVLNNVSLFSMGSIISNFYRGFYSTFKFYATSNQVWVWNVPRPCSPDFIKHSSQFSQFYKLDLYRVLQCTHQLKMALRCIEIRDSQFSIRSRVIFLCISQEYYRIQKNFRRQGWVTFAKWNVTSATQQITFCYR